LNSDGSDEEASMGCRPVEPVLGIAAALSGDITGVTVSSEQCDIEYAVRASDFDTYSWNGTGLDGGKTTITHFHLGEDHMA